MSLTAGTRLGVYEVLDPLGAGGMGQVYRARDTRLGREVAIKLLPEPFAGDAERLGRFAREAQLLAAFNHPNIAQIYGFEEATPQPFLVMELVDGPTLEQVLRSTGALPLDRALTIARQLAIALDAAHEKGIVHRDLKPANIKITEDDTVKVLDFGLAKALLDDAARRDPALSPAMATVTSPALTQMGIILGTAAYMSPEQARGKPVDKRADIWAFGCVLYEMLTGREPFAGETVTDILGAIVHKEPDLAALPLTVPPAVRQLLVRCLQKDVKSRLRDIGDAQSALTISDISTAGTLPPAPAAAVRSRTATVAASLIAGVAVGIAAGWLLFRDRDRPTASRVSFSWTAPGNLSISGVAVTQAGDAVVFEAGRLYVRTIADETVRPIPATEGARNLFLSPDGRWIGFYFGGKIRKVAFSGGDPLDICDVASDTPGAAWSRDGRIFYSTGWNGPLHAVDQNGGTPAPVSTVDKAAGESGHWWPEFLPDANVVLFTIWRAGSGINDARIGVLDLRTGRHRVLMPGSFARYLPSGHLLFFHAGAYHLAGFDAREVRVTSDPRRVLEGALPMDPNGTRVKPVSVASDGTIVYIARSLFPIYRYAWATRSGQLQELPIPARELGTAVLAPDGRRVVEGRVESGNHSLSLLDLARGVEDRLTSQGSASGPVWKRDGTAIAFNSMSEGHFDVAVRQLDDAGPRLLLSEPLDQTPYAWTRDGQHLLVYDYFADGTTGVTLADVSKPSPRQRLPMPSGDIQRVTLSPDDRWMAVEMGRREIIVQRFPGPGAPVRVSQDGGFNVEWSPNGRELFYLRGNGLFAVTYRDDNGRFSIEREERLFELDRFGLIGVAPDGRFLLGRIVSEPARVQVVLNWKPDA